MLDRNTPSRSIDFWIQNAIVILVFYSIGLIIISGVMCVSNSLSTLFGTSKIGTSSEKTETGLAVVSME